jgi:hypothetical protein
MEGESEKASRTEVLDWLILSRVGATGLEPVTPSVSSKGLPCASEANKGLAEISSSACTTACTSEAKLEQPDPVAALAAALLGLSPEDQARLAAMLVSGQRG